MDIKRAPKSKKNQYIAWGAGLVGIVAVSLGISKLKPAAPSVERATLWVDVVKQGELLREVRAAGTLVPEHMRIIAAVTAREATGEPVDLALVMVSAARVPDAIDEYQRVLEEVWQRIVVELGYRQPRSDLAAPNHGPDGRTDIYLAELGQFGMYGYCTVDDIRHRAAYCVVDNDFADFLAPAGQSLRVTAAHEFFHAIRRHAPQAGATTASDAAGTIARSPRSTRCTGTPRIAWKCGSRAASSASRKVGFSLSAPQHLH